jgi:hypothetical protein
MLATKITLKSTIVQSASDGVTACKLARVGTVSLLRIFCVLAKTGADAGNTVLTSSKNPRRALTTTSASELFST